MQTLFLPLSHPVSILIFIINIILSFTIIFLERKTPQSTYAWLLFLWVIPVLGFLFYLLFSQNLTRRKIFKYNTPENIAYQELLMKQRDDLIKNDTFIANTELVKEYQSNIEYNLNAAESLYSDDNTVEIFTDGYNKFDALFQAIENATAFVLLEYYIIKYDALGQRFMELLTKKAAEGVKIRLLFDQEGGRYIPQSALNKFEDAGGEFGVFFPSRMPFINLRVNYRDHRKLTIVDGKVGFIGGFNIGDEYLGLDKKMGYWRDTHLKITGISVYELQLRFLLDWHTSGKNVNLSFEDSVPEEFTSLENYKKKDGVGIQIVSSGPDNKDQIIKQGILKMIASAKEYIYIQTPYFVPDESTFEALKIALLSGIDVRIMVPNKPDHIFIYWATLSYVGELIDYGAKVYIYDNGFLHAKVIVVDDKISTVGSCNFDIRSFSLNFETNAFIYHEETTKKLREIFIEDIDKCIYYDTMSYNNRPRRLRIKESVSRLFSPLL